MRVNGIEPMSGVLETLMLPLHHTPYIADKKINLKIENKSEFILMTFNKFQ